MHKKLYWSNDKDVQALKKSLWSGEVSIVSTDTIYGFLANVTKEGFEGLNKLKGKRGDSPYLILIADIQKLSLFVEKNVITPEVFAFLTKCWPGPLTVIFQAKESLPHFIKSKMGTIALRCPKHDGLLKLLPSFDGLFSTSANKTIMPAPKTKNDIEADLIEKTAYLVVDEQEAQKAQASTIIDLTEPQNSVIKVVRKGNFAIEKLKENYESKEFIFTEKC